MHLLNQLRIVAIWCTSILFKLFSLSQWEHKGQMKQGDMTAV